MKTSSLIFVSFVLFCGQIQAQISSNKPLMVATNNALRATESNFFAVNSNLLNASVAPGGGFTGNPSQFSSAGGMSNIISGAALTNINAQGISNSGYAVVVGNQTNSNTFRIYLGGFSDIMDWYGTGGAYAYMDHLANFTTVGAITALAYNDNQGFHSDGTGNVFANNATIKTNIYAGTNEYLAGTNFPNYEVASNNITAGGQFIGLDTGLTNGAGQTIQIAIASTNTALLNQIAGSNYVKGISGHSTNQALQTPTTTNLTEAATLTATNISSASQSFGLSDGNGTGLFVNEITGAAMLTNSGSVSGAPSAAVALDLAGYVDITGEGLNVNTPSSFYQNVGIEAPFQYNQQNGSSGFWLYGTTTGGTQEVMDIAPPNFTSDWTNDLLVVTGNSNNANARFPGDGTIKAGQYWLNTTNVSGKSTYTMTMYDTRVLCNPTAASCTITAPASDNVGYVIPTHAIPFRGWGAQNGYIASGKPLEPAWLTTTYEVENLGSNTANTLTVSLPNTATNWGGTSLVIPNQMGLRMHYGGTNNVNTGYITAELYPLSPSPTYNLANCTNFPSTNLSAQQGHAVLNFPEADWMVGGSIGGNEAVSAANTTYLFRFAPKGTFTVSNVLTVVGGGPTGHFSFSVYNAASNVCGTTGILAAPGSGTYANYFFTNLAGGPFTFTNEVSYMIGWNADNTTNTFYSYGPSTTLQSIAIQNSSSYYIPCFGTAANAASAGANPSSTGAITTAPVGRVPLLIFNY